MLMHLELCTYLYIASRFKAKTSANLCTDPQSRDSPVLCGRSIGWREWAKSRGEQQLSQEERRRILKPLFGWNSGHTNVTTWIGRSSFRRNLFFVPNQVFQGFQGSCWQQHVRQMWSPRPLRHSAQRSTDGQVRPSALTTQTQSEPQESDLWLVEINFSAGYSGYFTCFELVLP